VALRDSVEMLPTFALILKSFAGRRLFSYRAADRTLSLYDRVIMVRHLLRNFLTSEIEYDCAFELWRSLIEDAAARAGQRGEWQPWRPIAFVDGTPIPRDGEPISDARSERLHRAISVMQHPPESERIDVAAWIAVRDWRKDETEPRTDDLTISLALSDEALDLAKQLIAHWMDPGISREHMEDVIRELLPAVAANG
jgi:hypothetical protein